MFPIFWQKETKRPGINVLLIQETEMTKEGFTQKVEQ